MLTGIFVYFKGFIFDPHRRLLLIGALKSNRYHVTLMVRFLPDSAAKIHN